MFLLFYIVCKNWILVLSNVTYYEVTAFNTHEREFLYKLHEINHNIFFLNGVTNEAATTMSVVVDDCCTNQFEEKLFKHDIQYTCVRSNVNYNNHNEFQRGKGLYRFLDWNDILIWVTKKVNEIPALTKTVIAKTYEHRDIFVLKLSSNMNAHKMAVFIVAGEEGRDWLSPAILINYINKLFESITNPKSLLYNFEFYFVPVLNPDGYMYSKTKDRFWSKNRNLIQPTKLCESDIPALGVNIDRNWFQAKSDYLNACHSVYVGNRPLSEVETKSLSYALNFTALKLVTFINLRGFENLITVPYAQQGKVASNHYVVVEIMKHASAVLKMQFNKTFPVGTAANYFYNFSGNVADWVKRLNIPVVFTVYMQHEEFLPSPAHILPLSEQFESLINITLIITREIYGSLYNSVEKNSPTCVVLITLSFILT